MLNSFMKCPEKFDFVAEAAQRCVVCDDAEVDGEFDNLKAKKAYRYIIFKIEDKKTIKVEKCGMREESYDMFLEALITECRYAVYDCEYTTDDGRSDSKLCFVAYNPDSCGVKEKMLYSTFKDTLKSRLPGVMREIQINDDSDKDFEKMSEACKK